MAKQTTEQNLLDQLFEEVPCYISVQDENLKITTANKRFKEHFGNTTGGFCYEIYKHRTSQCPDCPVVATFQDGNSHSTEEIVTSKFGKEYHVFTRTAPIRDDKGKIVQVMEMSTDITQTRQLQNHLTSLGLMLGSMSHGVKGLLTGLEGGIYQLESGLDQMDNKRVGKAFGQIKETTDKIKKMVFEILFYAKSGELQINKTDVTGLVGNVVTTIRPMAEKAGVQLEIRILENLGHIEVDSVWLEASLVNILENAIDACAVCQNGKRGIVEFAVHRKAKEHISFTIRDNGTGMDAETKNKIFSLFFSSKGVKGTGLGLFIAREVVRYHGGTMDVASKKGNGSRFKITIPIESAKK